MRPDPFLVFKLEKTRGNGFTKYEDLLENDEDKEQLQLRRRRLRRCAKAGLVWHDMEISICGRGHSLGVKGDEKREVVHVKTGKVKPIEGVVMYFDTSYTATRVVRL